MRPDQPAGSGPDRSGRREGLITGRTGAEPARRPKEKGTYSMKKTAHEKVLIVFMLVAAVLSAAGPQAEAKTTGEKKIPAPLALQGFRTGMSVNEVKKLLRKKQVGNYETGFSDLFVYEPMPGSETKLMFTCSPKGPVLGTIELSTAFDADETEPAVSRFKQKLTARYGAPSTGDARGKDLSLCWGQCDAGAGGARLEASVSPEKDRALLVRLHDGRLTRACVEQRRRKIGLWLNGWIADISKFRTGMTMKEAAILYQKRYRDAM